MGVLFTHPGLVDDVEAVFEEETRPANSFRLTLENGRLRWHDSEDNRSRVLRREPEAGFLRRLTAGIIGILPIESSCDLNLPIFHPESLNACVKSFKKPPRPYRAP